MSSSAGLVAREAAGRQLASPTAAASSWTPSSLSPDGRSPASLASLASAPASRADSVGSRFGQLIQHLQQGSFVPGDAAVLRAGGGALSLGALDGGGGPPPIASPTPSVPDGPPADGGGNVLIILLPLLIVLSTLLFLILVFLVFVIVLKRKSRIRLGDDGGPVDLSVGDGVWGEGGVDGVESRWLEQQDDDVRRGYQRAKDWQLHHPPSSVPSDITLSQFLTIQEKGVSAWSFEPDYESNMAVYVQARTEITFLDGPGMAVVEGGGNAVLANLPLPKLNEVYYFECKMYEKPEESEVAIGLATKPYPSFRLPGLSKYSVAYGSDGFRTHNYPFTTHSYGPPLREGDVLGVGYRPRTGTVFFTRNGRKHEDCYVGLQRFNLFPCVGASGPATVHVNLGQAGFVFIEANVKKWGLAPSIGTLAPPPAYGSERGSILLESGFIARRGAADDGDDEGEARGGAGRSWMSASSLASGSSSSHAAPVPSRPRRPSHRSRRPKPPSASTTPIYPSPLRLQAPTPASSSSATRAASPIAGPGPSSIQRAVESSSRDIDSATTSPYVSPVDRSPIVFNPPADPYASTSAAADAHADDGGNASDASSRRGSTGSDSDTDFHNHHAEHADEDADRDGSEAASVVLPHNPPTPNLADISLHTLRTDSFFGGREPAPVAGADGLTPYSAITDHRTRSSRTSSSSHSSSATARPPAGAGAHGARVENGSQTSPPGYSPLDPVVYASGVPTDLPASVISAAFEAEDRAEALARARAREAEAAAAAGADGEGSAAGGVWRWLRGGGGQQAADNASPA